MWRVNTSGVKRLLCSRLRAKHSVLTYQNPVESAQWPLLVDEEADSEERVHCFVKTKSGGSLFGKNKKFTRAL